MRHDLEGAPQPIRGALRWLELCSTAVRVQEDRLLDGEGDSMVDLWFCLVALRNAHRAFGLAIDVASDPEPLRQARSRYQSSRPAREIRDVFEHFDKALFGGGPRSRRARARPGLIAPTIAIHHRVDPNTGDYVRSVTVRLGKHTLEIPEATKAAVDLMWKVRKLLRQQIGLPPFS